MKRVDWVSAKQDYVNNTMLTFQDIADKYGSTRGTVSTMASRQQWTEARGKHVELLAEKTSKKTITNAADRLATCNEKNLNAAAKLRELIIRKIELVRSENPESKDVRQLAGALESIQRVENLALGAATELTGQVEHVDLTLLDEKEFTSIESLYAKANPRRETTAGCDALQ